MSLPLVFHPPSDVGGEALDAAAWRSDSFDFRAFDRHVDTLVARGAPLAIRASPDEVDTLRTEITLRTQRLAAHAAPNWLVPVLTEHRQLHDPTKSDELADLDHAHDTWQWSLRLDLTASPAVQLAALLHHIEHLDLARELLARAGVSAALVGEACALIAMHQRPDASLQLQAINDADALSFFSLECAAYLADFGPEQTARKVVHAFARMSPWACAWLPSLRMPRLVRAYVCVCQLL